MTIYDIAKEAGVAASTVSRVMNNKPGIKAETREKVQTLLAKYNYIPNVAARGLAMQSTKMIGILIEDIRVAHHTESAFFIEQQLVKEGYCCITMGTGTSEEMKVDYIRILEQRRVEGVILMGSMFMTERVKKSIQKHLSQIPVVIVNGYIDLPNVSGVLVDEYHGIKQCVDLLINSFKTKIAFVIEAYSPSNISKQQGYIDAMLQYGKSRDEIWLYEAAEKSVMAGYEATKRILLEHPDVQGIVYSVDLIAVGGVRAAYDMGRKVPEQLGIIGVDNSTYGEICMPRLTSLDNKLRQISETTAVILKKGLEGNIQNTKIIVQPEIIERESTERVQ